MLLRLLIEIQVDSESAEHLIGIFVSLFRHLPTDSPERLRLLIKFAENNYSKITTLLTIREDFISKLARIDIELQTENVDVQGETEEEKKQRWYLRKVAGGGFVVQLCAILMGWLAIEDKGMRKFIDEKVGLDEIRETMRGIPSTLFFSPPLSLADVWELIGVRTIKEY